MKKKLSKLVVVALCITMLPVPEVRAAKKPTVTKSMKLTVGQSKTIKVKGSYIKSKKFKTSNKKIATVTKKGKVTAKKKGNCKITVTVKYKKSKKAKKYSTKKFKCSVSVKKKEQGKIKPTVTPTDKPVTTEKPTNKPITTEKPKDNVTGKNADDVKAIKEIIAEQRKLGATISENLDDEDMYEWEKLKNDDTELRLVRISWGIIFPIL